LAVTGNATISGDLTVSGTTTYINTTTLNVGDNIITLNADIGASTAPTENAGIEVKRGNAATKAFYWEEANDRWYAEDGLYVAGNVVLSGTVDTGQGATEVYLMNQNVRTTDSVTFANVTSNLTGTADRAEAVDSNDTRNVNDTPSSKNAGVYFDFKTNSVNGLSDGGTYNGQMFWRSYGSSTDLSGGYPIQIAYTANGRIWSRLGTSSSAWASWQQILNSVDQIYAYNMNQYVRTTDAPTFAGLNSTDTITVKSNGTPSGVRAFNADSVLRLQNTNSNNYLEFRNQADTGTYGGILFTDNNVGGYIAFRTYVGSGANNGTNGDYMIYGTYTDHIFQAGSSETVNGKSEIFRMYANGDVRAQGGMYATIYYDSADTTYRFNGDGSSVLNELTTFGSTTIRNNYNTGQNLKLNLNDSGAYGLVDFQENGSHKGFFGLGGSTQSFGTYAAYTADGFSWNHDGAGKMIIANRGASKRIDLNTGTESNTNFTTIRMTNQNVYITPDSNTGTLDAPIFRELTSTGYYLDPSSTGTSLSIGGGIITTAPNGAILLKHSVSEANAWIFQENAPDWGLYWFNTGAQSGQGIGSYTTVGAELFGMRNGTTTNAYNPPDSWSGVTASSFSTWMLSNFSGYIWSASTIYAAGDMRAPILYDTDNTGYYINPASFTEIYGGLRMSGGHGDSTIRNRLLASNNGAGTGVVHMQWWCSEPGNTWDWGGFGYNVDNTYNDGSGPYYFSRPNTSFGNAYFRFSTNGSMYVYNSNTSGTRVTNMEFYPSGYVYANNYLEGGNSLRAPIFYDSNNTGYYIDANSTSQLNRLNINNGLIAGGVENGSVILYKTSNPFSLGGTDAVLTVSDRSNNDWGIRVDKTGFDYGMYVTVTAGATYAYYLDGGRYRVNGQGYLFTPIMYDSDNTGYYLEPEGNSNLNQAVFQGNRLVIRGGSPTLYFRDTDEQSAMLHNNSNRLYVLRGGVDSESWSTVNGYWPQYWQLNTNYCLLGGVTETVSDFRAPIFYDSNDTGYYLDQNSTSDSALRIRGGALHGPNPSWGAYMWVGSNGRPNSWGSAVITNGNLHLDCQNGYETYINHYSGNRTYTYEQRTTFIYDYNNTGYYMDMDGTSRTNYMVPNRIILVNNVNNEPRWDFTAYVVEAQHWYGNNYSQTMYLGEAGNAVQIRGTPRAPIFYDYDDTGYYLDPNTTSNDALRIRGGALHGPNPSWGAYFRSGCNGRVDGWASVETTNGNLHMDCRDGYETYINHYNGNRTYLYEIRTNFIYDRDNTGYYMDPNGTSRMNYVIHDNVYSYSWIFSQNNIIAYYSDERLKTNLGPIENPLDKVHQLNGFYYIENDLARSFGYMDEKVQVGLSAQQVQAVLPQVVTLAPFDMDIDEDTREIKGSKTGENYLTVDYEKIVPLLVEAIKELSEDLNKTKDEVKELRKLIEEK
jgi:hypothetical protein